LIICYCYAFQDELCLNNPRFEYTFNWSRISQKTRQLFRRSHFCVQFTLYGTLENSEL